MSILCIGATFTSAFGYNITFGCGSHTGTPTTPAATSGNYGDTVSWGTNVVGCNQNGASLVGWICDTTSYPLLVDYSGNNYSITIKTSDVVCNAVWSNDPQYHVTYTCGSSASGGTPPPQINNIYQGSSPVLADAPGTCYNNDAWYFVDWSCTGDSTGNFVVTTTNGNNNNIIMSMPNENVTCQAGWDCNKRRAWQLFYDCGAGGGTPPATQYVWGPADCQGSSPFSGNVTLSANSCTAPGYSFNGWMCYETDLGIFGIQNQSNLPTFESAGGNYNLGTNVTCVARWEADKPCEPGSSVSDKEEILGMTISTTAEDSEEWTEGITLGELFDSSNSLTIWWPNQPSPPYGIGSQGTNHSWMVQIGGMCSSDVGTPGETGNPTPNVNGTQCWCQATGYNPTDADPQEGDVKPLVGYPYVYLRPWTGNNACTDDECALLCVDTIQGEQHWLNWQTIHTDFWSHFFHSLYTKDVCEYTINYYCSTSATTPTPPPGSAVGGASNVFLVNPCSPPSGSAFDRWDCTEASTPNNTVAVNNGSITMPYDNVNCRANWRQIPYSITYDCANNVYGESSMNGGNNYHSGTSVTLWDDLGNGFVGDGVNNNNRCTVPQNWTFNGWSCTNTTVTNNAITMPANNVTCTAQWTQICTITLNPNNGTFSDEGGDSSNSANSIKTIYSKYGDGAYKTNTNGILSNKMTNQSGLSDTPPSPALGIPVGRNVTVTFDAQTPAPTNPVTGNQYSVTNPNNSVGQREFAGYYSIQSLGGAQLTNPNILFADEQYIDADGYITSYGQTAAENIDPINDTCPTWYAHYTCPTIFFPYINLIGYTLMRWRTASLSLTMGTQYPGGRTQVRCVDTDMNAVWQANTYTIQYVLNGGTHGTDHQESATYDIEFPVSNPTRNGYTFAGWTITGMDGVTHYYSANSITPNGVYQSSTTQTTTNTQLAGITDTHFMNLRSTSGTVTFTAQWTPNLTYTLTYVENAPSGTTVSGMPTPNPVTSLTAGATPTLASGPTVPGYIFDRWDCKDENQNTVTVDSNQTSGVLTITMPSSNVTCTAQWTPNMVGLVWNDNGATTAHGGNPSNSCQYGPGSISVPTQPAKTGYSFNGWLVTNWACSLANVDPYLTTYRDSTRLRWKPINTTSGYTMNDYFGTENSSDLSAGEWAVAFSYGIVNGIAKCSTTPGTLGTTGTPNDTPGEYCWCQATKYTSPDGNQCNITSPVWAFAVQGINCTSYCAYNCASVLQTYTTFRSAIYGQ